LDDGDTKHNGGRARLEELMARLADGDQAAVIALYVEFATPISAALRSHLRAVGCDGIGRADLDGLVLDACFALADCARAWRPDGGALPWVWAARRLRVLASAHVGQYGETFDPDRHEPDGASPPAPAGDDADSQVEVLDRLASAHPLCRLLREALAQVGSARDGEIFLELQVQRLAGDRSPAVTVGRQFGLRPAAVRQVRRRTRARLRSLADIDDRFAPLAALDLVA